MGMPTRSPKPTPHTTRDPTACCNDSRVMAIPAFAIAKIGTATKLAQPCNRCSSHSTVDTDDFASRTVMAACPTSDTSASSSWSMSSWRVNGCVGASRPMTTPAKRRVDSRLVQGPPEHDAKSPVHTDRGAPATSKNDDCHDGECSRDQQRLRGQKVTGRTNYRSSDRGWTHR